MDFNPIKATETLRQHAVDIEALGEKLESTRLALIVAQAALYDTEKEARDDLFLERESVQASKVRDWMKWRVIAEQHQVDKLREELRLLVEKKEIMIEVVNATKASMRMWEIEAKFLNNKT